MLTHAQKRFVGMNHFVTIKFFKLIILPGMASALILAQGLRAPAADNSTVGTALDPAPVASGQVMELPHSPETGYTAPVAYQVQENILPSTSPAYAFGNPAGCSNISPNDLSTDQMLANVQTMIGTEYNLAERRQAYIWHGETGGMLNVTNDPYVFEFVFNEFQHPLTYRGDKVATIFMTNGFVVWFREYGGNFRLLAIPMKEGVLESPWASYVTSYWQINGTPNDAYIYPVMKKLPCHWTVDSGYVTSETLTSMFPFDWNIPDYLSAGRQYLAGTCEDAYRVSQEKLGHWDATSMCGPLGWSILRDVNGFPYRIGSWTKDAGAFTGANPRWSGQPWGTFDPSTFTLTHTDSPMPGYDFEKLGNLYPGDIIYSFATFYATPGYFDHIFVVAAVDENYTRWTVSNMVQNSPYADCSIEEVPLYTPGDRQNGVINHAWNGFGFGQTGTTGFDIFRWNWVTYHINGQPLQYSVRWGDTIETIAFDWKVSPQSILDDNQQLGDVQFIPGQIITLPQPEPFTSQVNVDQK